MTFFAEFTLMALTAIFLENLIFSRALGASRMLSTVKQGKSLPVFGVLLTAMTVLASIAIYPLNLLLTEAQIKVYYRPVLYVLVITALYAAVYLTLKKLLPAAHAKLGSMLTFATFNCAMLGSVLLTIDQTFNFAKTVGFGLGSGIGFTLAMLLMREGKRRLALCNVPKSFRGFPVSLLYLGMVALAMYGLVGHQLPF